VCVCVNAGNCVNCCIISGPAYHSQQYNSRYRIEEIFVGSNFADGQSSKFSQFNFCGARDHALYNHAYFAGLIFVDNSSSAKIGPLENVPLYGILIHLIPTAEPVSRLPTSAALL
jgi:hypothetical protein